MLNLNTYPYFDDYSADKGFHKILFHPGKPVQARELTQIQSILQEQIKRHGDHVFKNGTVVIPGHVFYDDKVKYLKLQASYNQISIYNYISSLIGKTIKGDINGITALVVHADAPVNGDPATLYIKYTSGSGTIKEFVGAESMTCAELPGLLFAVENVTDFTGNASICTIDDGVYYVNGYFVGVNKQSVTVSKYSNTASAVVGLEYIESIVTEATDESLYDNAFGFSNFGAPGSHRLKISLTLVNKAYDYSTADTSEIKFIDLLKVKNGNIEYLKNDTKYAEIEKWLARRTYETSGDYVIKPFVSTAHNYRTNIRGAFVASNPYLMGDIVTNAGHSYMALNTGYSGSTAPTHTFGMVSDGSIYWNEVPNANKFKNGGKSYVSSSVLDDHVVAESKLFIETTPGKAYVKGFEIEFNTPTNALVSKARQTRQLTQAQLYAPAGSYVVVDTIVGLPNITDDLTKVDIKNVSGTIIGSAFVRTLEYVTGTPGTTAEYRLFLFDVMMVSGYNFARDAHSVAAGSVFSANIKPTLIPLSGSVTTNNTTSVVGTGTYFDFELVKNDRVKVGTSTYAIVSSVTSPSAFVATANVATATNAPIYKAISEVVKLGNYVRELPTSSISTIRNSLGAIDMQYVVTKFYSISTTGTSHVITLANGETFLPSKHIVVRVSDGAVINATYALDTPATTLTISGLVTSTAYKVLTLVTRTGAFAKEKSKSLAVSTLTLTDATASKYYDKVISLGEADILRIVKITSSGDANDKANYVATGESDITNKFILDNGQKPDFYDVGRITTSEAQTRPIRITFEYFTHSAGDYFSVDSYSSIPRALLMPTRIEDKSYFLPDCLDFRSRIADNGTTFSVAGGASVSDPLVSDNTISTSYAYYLPRVDELGISTDGKMTYATGGKIVDGMKLATINVDAYTATPSKNVSFSDDQVSTFTMENLKSIESRVDSIESQVALSEIEKSTVAMSIKDQFGLERDKNGFLIDDFTTFNVSDGTNPDLKTAIDPINKECRALSVLENLNFSEPDGITDAARTAANYQLTGSYITLPYTEVPMINQVMASKQEVIQAYATLDFTGVLNVVPGIDNYTTNIYSPSPVDDPALRLSDRTDPTVNKTSRVFGGIIYTRRNSRNSRRRGSGE